METTENRAPRRPAARAGLQQRLARWLLPGCVCIPWPWHVVRGSGEKFCQELAQQSPVLRGLLEPLRHHILVSCAASCSWGWLRFAP